MGSFRKDLAIIGRAAAGTHDYCCPTLYGHRALRCGNGYSQEPCKGGRTVETSPILSDPRGPATSSGCAADGAPAPGHSDCAGR